MRYFDSAALLLHSLNMDAPAYCWLTAPGAAAISLLIVHESAAAVAFGGALAEASDVPRRLWLRDAAGSVIDEAVCARAGDGVIVSCHGGPAVRNAVEAALTAAGLQPGSFRPWTSPQAELLPLAHGRLGAELVLRAMAGGAEALNALPPARQAALQPALAQARYVFAPPRVQLWGPVNAGKSSLLNALCGATLAAVADEPGLTRDVIEGSFEYKGFVVRVFDAPGEMADARGIDEAALQLARQWKAEADLVLRLVPPGSSAPPTNEREWVLFSRADEDPQRREPAISARDAAGIEALKQRITLHFVGMLLALPPQLRVAP